MSLEGRQNDELNRNKNQTVTAAKKMEKLVVLVGLIVHIKKKKQMPCFNSLLSGVPVLQAFAK